MRHREGASRDAARLLESRRAALVRELDGRRSLVADALGIAAALLDDRAPDLTAARRLASDSSGRTDAATRRIEARHRPDLAEGIALSGLLAPELNDARDRSRAEVAAFALDLLSIGEGASAGLPEAFAGARLVLRLLQRPGWSLRSFVHGLREPDEGEAEDLRLFRALPDALATERGQAPHVVDWLLPTDRDKPRQVAPVTAHISSIPSSFAPAGEERPKVGLDGATASMLDNATSRPHARRRTDMHDAKVSPLLLDVLALAKAEPMQFVAAALHELGSRRPAWTRCAEVSASPDQEVRLTMMRLMGGRLDAVVEIGRSLLISDGDRVAITTQGRTPHTLTGSMAGRALTEVVPTPVLTRADNCVLHAESLEAANITIIQVAAPGVFVGDLPRKG